MTYTAARDLETMDKQIEIFLSSVIERTNPRWIITTERKGTAFLRTYANRVLNPRATQNIWARVLSSQAVRELPEAFLSEGTILLLDECMYGGHSVSNMLKLLTEEKHIARDRVKVAVFGVHEHSSSQAPDFRWLGQLTDETYRRVRDGLIRMFQQQGSLLLDTEHIEVPVEIKCGRLEFFEALSRAGCGVTYLSSGDRINLTIHNPVLVDEQEFLAHLPAKTIIKNVVRKIRVVERAKDRFAIIPIFYPSTPSDANKASLSFIDESLSNLAGTPEINFHLLGIFASLNLFQTAFMCLRDLIGQGKVNVRIPHPGDADDSLSHMLALFPTLNIEMLHSSLERFVEAGRKWKARRSDLQEPRLIDACEGTLASRQLDEYQWLSLREVSRIAHELPNSAVGVTLQELMLLAEDGDDMQRKKNEALLSAALDRAIDDAELVPDVSRMTFADGQIRYTRTFRIDGEMISADVRRVAALWRGSMPPPGAER